MAGDDILKTLIQAKASGFLDAEGAGRLREVSPRFVMMLCDGLSGRFGPVPPYRFKQLAEERKITADALFEAMK